MIYGNMEGTGSSKESKERRTAAKKKAKIISDYFQLRQVVCKHLNLTINYSS